MIHSINNFNLNINLPQLLANNRGPVSDDFVGVIKYDGTNFVNFNNQKGDFGLQINNTPNNANVQQRVEVDYNNLPYKYNDRIVIIIESPHLDEYKINNNLNISGPAIGASGARFNSNCIDGFNNNIVTLKNVLNITSNTMII